MTPFLPMLASLLGGVGLLALGTSVQGGAASWCLYGLGGFMVAAVVLRMATP